MIELKNQQMSMNMTRLSKRLMRNNLLTTHMRKTYQTLRLRKTLMQVSSLHFTDVNDEIDCNACFRSMTFIDPTNDNYAIKLASAQRAKKTPLTRGNSHRTGGQPSSEI